MEFPMFRSGETQILKWYVKLKVKVKKMQNRILWVSFIAPSALILLGALHYLQIAFLVILFFSFVLQLIIYKCHLGFTWYCVWQLNLLDILSSGSSGWVRGWGIQETWNICGGLWRPFLWLSFIEWMGTRRGTFPLWTHYWSSGWRQHWIAVSVSFFFLKKTIKKF